MNGAVLIAGESRPMIVRAPAAKAARVDVEALAASKFRGPMLKPRTVAIHESGTSSLDQLFSAHGSINRHKVESDR